MSKFRKYLVMLFTLALLLLTPNIDAHALVDGGAEGELDNGWETGVKEGATWSKTGFLIWLSDKDGAMWSGVAFVPTTGSMFYPNDSSVTIKGLPFVTRNNNSVTNKIFTGSTVPWGLSPYDSGCEASIENFLRQPYGNMDSGVEWAMEKYLKMDKSARQLIMDKVADGKEICINFESIALMGRYDKSVFLGEAWYGNVVTFAAIMDRNNWVARFSHANMPNNVYLTRNWLGLRPVDNPSGIHSSEEILAYPRKGFGLSSYMLQPNDQKQVVKIYTSDGNVEETKYTKGSSPYQVKDEDDYKVIRWATSEQETQATGTKANWNTVTSGCTLVQQGQSPQKVTMPEDEVAIFIEYEKEPDPLPPPSNNSEALRAYEVNYPYPKMVGVVSRTDTGAVPADYDFNTGFQNHKNSMNSRDDIKDYQEATSDFTVHESFSGALSGLNVSQLHLYHTRVGKYKP